MLRHSLLATAVAGLLLATPAMAQTATTPTPNSEAAVQQMSQVTKAQDFVTFAAMSDLFEIQTGQMAEAQAGNKEVAAFGKQLVKDHTKSSKQLMKLAAAAKVEATPPTQLDQRHQVIADSLKDAKGAGFDTAFAQAQVAAHQEGIALFKSYAENGDNPELKAFAKKGLPILQKHLDMAQKMAGMPTQ
jgi:putative membrane protein